MDYFNDPELNGKYLGPAAPRGQRKSGWGIAAP